MLSFLKYIIPPSSVQCTDDDIFPFPEDRFDDLRKIISNSKWDSNAKRDCNLVIDYFIDTDRIDVLDMKRKEAKLSDKSTFADDLIRFLLVYQ